MKLLVATDFSPSSKKLLRVARRLAQALAAHLSILHVAMREPEFVAYGAGKRADRDRTASEYKEEHRLVQEASDAMRDAGVEANGLVVPGIPADVILAEAAKLEADMIILGSHGFGAVFKMLLGSVSSAVLKKAACAVLIVPSEKAPDA